MKVKGKECLSLIPELNTTSPSEGFFFCPQPKDIQLTVQEEKRKQKIITFN